MIKLSDLLRLLDRYPYTVPLKCGHAQFLAKRIYITSPFHPKDWYPNCGEQMKQLFRRISKIRYFYREIDDTDDVTAIQYTSTLKRGAINGAADREVARGRLRSYNKDSERTCSGSITRSP